MKKKNDEYLHKSIVRLDNETRQGTKLPKQWETGETKNKLV